MSTKLHHGYRYRPTDGTRPDPFTLAGELRAALRPVMLAAYRRRVAEIATEIYDGIGLDGHADEAGDEVRDRYPIIDAERRIAAAASEIAATRTRNPAMDFSCKLSILPDPDDPAALYLLAYCEQDIDAALTSIDGVSEYRYFNNTDRPEGHTEESWAERAETWDRVLGYDAPVDRGLIWELEDLSFEATFRDRDALVAAIPERATRAKRIAVRRAVTSIEVPAEVREQHSASRFMELVMGARDAALADTDRIAEIEAGLSELTFEDLIGPVHP